MSQLNLDKFANDTEDLRGSEVIMRDQLLEEDALQELYAEAASTSMEAVQRNSANLEVKRLIVYEQRRMFAFSEAAFEDARVGEIPVVPLEDILNEEGVAQIDALKIDIEGYEYRALKPFFTHCSKKMWPKKISIEHLTTEQSGDKSDIETLLVEIGYSFRGKTRSNAFYSIGG